jgi:hypothetical protein
MVGLAHGRIFGARQFEAGGLLRLCAAHAGVRLRIRMSPDA